jgi:hypothetical protein
MLRANLAAAFIVLAGLAVASIASLQGQTPPSGAAVALEEVSTTGCPYLDGGETGALPPPGHPRVDGDRRLPRGHPPVEGDDLALPPGHPPVDRHRPSGLTPARPPLDGAPVFTPRLDERTIVDT